MADFSTSVDLELEVSSRSLRSARSTIEQELGDIEIGVTAGGGAGAGRQQGQLAGILDANRRQFELAEQRNDLLDEIKDSLDGGGGVGGSNGLFGGVLGGRISGSGVTSGAVGGLASRLSLGGAAGAFASGGLTSILGATAVGVGGGALAGQALKDLGVALGLRGEEMSETTISDRRRRAARGEAEIATFEWPELPALEWPELPALESEVRWPAYPDLSTNVQWPELPRGLESFLGGGGTPNATSLGLAPSDQRLVNEANLNQRRGGGINIDVGDIIARVSTTIETNIEDAISDAVEGVENELDDAVSGIESDIDSGFQELERRIPKALRGDLF